MHQSGVIRPKLSSSESFSILNPELKALLWRSFYKLKRLTYDRSLCRIATLQIRIVLTYCRILTHGVWPTPHPIRNDLWCNVNEWHIQSGPQRLPTKFFFTYRNEWPMTIGPRMCTQVAAGVLWSTLLGPRLKLRMERARLCVQKVEEGFQSYSSCPPCCGWASMKPLAPLTCSIINGAPRWALSTHSPH
jgi:hypothetical protein